MTKSMRVLLVGAALAGFAAGTTANAPTQATGQDATDTKPCPDSKKKEKHACKGLNSCKHQGGCGATKGSNECKAQGGCRTDCKPMKTDEKPMKKGKK